MRLLLQMRNVRLAIIILTAFIIFTGCSKRNVVKIGAKAISPMLPDIVHMVMAGVNTSYGQGMSGIPALISLAGGLSEIDPNNYTLGWSASQVFGATAVYNEMFNTDYASELAWQGYRYGIRSLKTHKKFRKAIETGTPVEKAVELLPKKYVEGLTWTGMSLLVWMMMNTDDIMCISYAGEANNLVKRACELDGGYFYGLPHMLNALWSAMASNLVQGCGLEPARASWAKMKEVNDGKLLLADAYWAQLYAVAIKDRKLYKTLLTNVIEAPDDILEYRGFYITTLAKGRAKWLLAHQEEIFMNLGTVR